jgi:nucleotide-binding universal stress UspA family protein
MTYSTLMVHLDLGAPNNHLLSIAADLAERFKASVIGIAACQPMQLTYGDGSMSYMSADVIEQDRTEMEKEMNAAEGRFRAALQGKSADVSWRSMVSFTSLADYVADQAAATDLLITNPDVGPTLFDSTRRVNIGDLVMRIGRPLLVVPSEGTRPEADKLNLENVVIGWKGTRETRRAVADALPLLKKAGQVTVVEIVADAGLADARERLQDVVGWLKRHGIAGVARAEPSVGDDASRLDSIAQDNGAGLLVAGAYGHNRLREWVLGGVTRDLLLRPVTCALVSH